jgi:hypothetical protein
MSYCGAFVLGVGFGVIVPTSESFEFLMSDKNVYAACLVLISFGYFVIVEFGARVLMTNEGIALKTVFIGNPLLRFFLFRVFAFLAGGWFVYDRYQLTGIYSSAIFSTLIFFFVGGFFETYRLLKEKI